MKTTMTIKERMKILKKLPALTKVRDFRTGHEYTKLKNIGSYMYCSSTDQEEYFIMKSMSTLTCDAIEVIEKIKG